MSGGHFNYQDGALKNAIFYYDDKVSNQFEDIEISNLVFDVLDLIHDYDWYISGDTGREDWLRARKVFKDKWLKGDRSDRLKALIDSRLAEVSDELKEML